jgi:hypothetical protein
MAKVGAGGSFWPQGGRIEMHKGRPADGLFLLTAASQNDPQGASATRKGETLACNQLMFYETAVPVSHARHGKLISGKGP